MNKGRESARGGGTPRGKSGKGRQSVQQPETQGSRHWDTAMMAGQMQHVEAEQPAVDDGLARSTQEAQQAP